jgi:hypothetical protein
VRHYLKNNIKIKRAQSVPQVEDNFLSPGFREKEREGEEGEEEEGREGEGGVGRRGGRGRGGGGSFMESCVEKGSEAIFRLRDKKIIVYCVLCIMVTEYS